MAETLLTFDGLYASIYVSQRERVGSSVIQPFQFLYRVAGESRLRPIGRVHQGLGIALMMGAFPGGAVGGDGAVLPGEATLQG